MQLMVLAVRFSKWQRTVFNTECNTKHTSHAAPVQWTFDFVFVPYGHDVQSYCDVLHEMGEYTDESFAEAERNFEGKYDVYESTPLGEGVQYVIMNERVYYVHEQTVPSDKLCPMLIRVGMMSAAK
eukprot:4004373-Amphidinium_carterae.1